MAADNSNLRKDPLSQLRVVFFPLIGWELQS